jgi:hypothetical protein
MPVHILPPQAWAKVIWTGTLEGLGGMPKLHPERSDFNGPIQRMVRSTVRCRTRTVPPRVDARHTAAHRKVRHTA